MLFFYGTPGFTELEYAEGFGDDWIVQTGPLSCPTNSC